MHSWHLLELHHKQTVKEGLKPFAAKNDNYGDSDQQAAQILDVLYAECTEVFAVGLRSFMTSFLHHHSWSRLADQHHDKQH